MCSQNMVHLGSNHYPNILLYLSYIYYIQSWRSFQGSKRRTFRYRWYLAVIIFHISVKKFYLILLSTKVIYLSYGLPSKPNQFWDLAIYCTITTQVLANINWRHSVKNPHWETLYLLIYPRVFSIYYQLVLGETQYGIRDRSLSHGIIS